MELEMYRKGNGVPQDDYKAVKLYRKACNGGNVRGCNNLGNMYDEGKGVPQDYDKAIKLYKKACNGGNALGL